jgi:transposase-like protein
MQEGQLLMTQADRDRLVTLRKAKKRLITQSQAGEELGLSVRHVKRLIYALKKRGDKAVIHGLRGKPSNQRIAKTVEQEAVQILSADLYKGFGPTLASEYLADKHDIEVSKETVRQWMIRAKLWRAKEQKLKAVHVWRPRRSRLGELVQWDTSEHDWLEGRGEKLYLIAMIDDATSRLFARFVRHDTTEENMKLLRSYLEKFGRPLAFYTDKAAIFQTAEKRKRDEPGVDKDSVEMPPTQIGRALQELGIAWIAAHSPQAKGRVERNFGTAQDRLVKGLRVAGVKTLEQANQYLEETYLVWWERELTVEPAHPDNAHRPLDKSHSLEASLSHVETRQVRNDYTIRLDAELYRIERQAVVSGLRKADVRVEKRLDGSIAVRFGERYLPVRRCAAAAKTKAPPVKRASSRRPANKRRGSDWCTNFDLTSGPKTWQAAQRSGHRSGRQPE